MLNEEMNDFPSIGKILLFGGLAIAALGAIILIFGRIPFLGKLPGDIRIEKENFSVYVPITTCILLSVLLSLIFWVVSKLK